LPGVGRKSANVILREAGKAPEGVIVDLHVVRVAPRLGIATGADPKKIEKQIMEALPQKEWDAGMAMSFLGREICRPKPKCELCLMRPVCQYYQNIVKEVKGRGPVLRLVVSGKKDLTDGCHADEGGICMYDVYEPAGLRRDPSFLGVTTREKCLQQIVRLTLRYHSLQYHSVLNDFTGLVLTDFNIS